MTHQHIKSGDELRGWFFEVRKIKRKLDSGINVTTKIRKEILTSIDQDKITLDGRVKRIKFTSLGGGVYRANIVDIIQS